MLLIKIYNYLKTRKFIFRLPRHVDVLEFDSCNPQLTNRVVGDIMTLYCLNIRENFYINIKIVFLAAFYLKNKGIKGYWLAVFDTIAPKVIITLIEQHLTFSWFNKNYEKSQFLAIGGFSTCFFDVAPIKSNSFRFARKLGMGHCSYRRFSTHHQRKQRIHIVKP